MKSDAEKVPFPKVTFTIPASLLEKIDNAAAADSRSRSQWMALQFERFLAESDVRHAPLESVESAAPVPAKKRSGK